MTVFHLQVDPGSSARSMTLGECNIRPFTERPDFYSTQARIGADRCVLQYGCSSTYLDDGRRFLSSLNMVRTHSRHELPPRSHGTIHPFKSSLKMEVLLTRLPSLLAVFACGDDITLRLIAIRRQSAGAVQSSMVTLGSLSLGPVRRARWALVLLWRSLTTQQRRFFITILLAGFAANFQRRGGYLQRVTRLFKGQCSNQEDEELGHSGECSKGKMRLVR